MATAWGDIPYYSYGSDDPDFQALNLSGVETAIITPVYAPQEKIFADILNELSAAMISLMSLLMGWRQTTSMVVMWLHGRNLLLHYD